MEKYRDEFAKEIGELTYQRTILHFGVVKCTILPIQSSAFSLGHDWALRKIFFAKNRKEKEAVFKDMSKNFTINAFIKLLVDPSGTSEGQNDEIF